MPAMYGGEQDHFRDKGQGMSDKGVTSDKLCGSGFWVKREGRKK